MGGFFAGQFDQKRLLSSLSPVPMAPVAALDNTPFSPRDTMKGIAGMRDEGSSPSAPGIAAKTSSVNSSSSSNQSMSASGASAILTEEKAKDQASTALLGK